MKKQANILEYVEKYKYKYGISYMTEDSKFVKRLMLFIKTLLIYTVVFLPIMEWSLLINAQKVAHTTQNFSFSSINKSTYAAEFYVILISILLLIALLVLIKKNKFLSAAALVIMPIVVYCFATCTENQNGFGYKPTFYFLAVPAAIMCLLIAILLFILIRATIKTNKLYNMLVEGLYRQYGTRDGEKLTDIEWGEFLNNYNPYKQIT